MNLELRYEVLNRDGYHCVECGSRHNLQVHHIFYPDSDTSDNLTTLCSSCHRRIHGNGFDVYTPSATIRVGKSGLRLSKMRARLTLKDGKTRSMDELIDMLLDAYEETEEK